MQQHFGSHSIDVIAALLATGPSFERSKNDSTRSCGGKQEWRVQLVQPQLKGLKYLRGPGGLELPSQPRDET